MESNSRQSLNPSWIVVAAGISASLHVGKLPPALSVLQQSLGISLVQAGFLLSTVQVAGMGLGLVVGLGADKWGLRRSVLVGLMLMALSSMVGAAATGFAWLLALRVLEGLGFLLVAMPAPGLIRRNVRPSELSGRMGWWGSYMPIGSAMGLMLGPWVLQATSWQTWWIALGCSSALAALAVWRWVPADAVHAAAASAPADQGWRPRLQLTLRSPGPWLVSLGFMLYSGQWMGIVGFLPTMYAQAGLSAKLAGMLTAVVAAANIVGNVASGKLLYLGWSAKRCLQTGYLMMGLTVLLAYLQIGGEPLAPLWLRFVAVVLFSAAGGLIPATLFTSAMHLAPSQGTVSTTVGFMQQWSCVGQFAGPPLVAAVATHMGGWQFTWMVTGSMCVLGWLLALGVHRCWSRVER